MATMVNLRSIKYENPFKVTSIKRHCLLSMSKYAWKTSPTSLCSKARKYAASCNSKDVQINSNSDLEEECINTIRMLTVDSVTNAKAGHPGAAMGLAPLGFLLFRDIMNFNPEEPHWLNRDRFVLSAGHAVLLQYILLHLTGYDIRIDDLKDLVKLGSRTPGHPENLVTPGIEMVTGPLGQGVANCVGLAAAEVHLAARFNRPGFKIVDHYTYCIMGDGCVMEGISNEASSLAGHWGLGKLIVFYDDNKNTIDGSTRLALSENVSEKYRAFGWHVQRIPVENYGDLNLLKQAILTAKEESEKPSLIVLETIIGFGSPSKEGTNKAHHGPFSPEEVQKIKEKLNWKNRQPFFVPHEVYSEMRTGAERGELAEIEWGDLFSKYEKKYPLKATEFKKLWSKKLPNDWETSLPKWTPEDSPDATRGFSEIVLNSLAAIHPGILGGSADLAGSNKAYLHSFDDFQRETPHGRNFRFGVREHAMAAICNGMSLHGSGLIPFAATFLVFTDYMRPALRLSALSHAKVIFLATHDSIGLGEDGPTHQPVEHLASLRAIPNLNVYRPGDGNETTAAYISAVSRNHGPTLIALSRQKISAQLWGSSITGALKGGYILNEGGKRRGDDGKNSKKLPDVIILGSGSELVLCQEASWKLGEEGIRARVVSIVCWEIFENQKKEYIDSVIPLTVKARLSVEAGSVQGWRQWVGDDGEMLGVHSFGRSGKYLDVFESFGFTVDNIVRMSKLLLQKLGC